MRIQTSSPGEPGGPCTIDSIIIIIATDSPLYSRNARTGALPFPCYTASRRRWRNRCRWGAQLCTAGSGTDIRPSRNGLCVSGAASPAPAGRLALREDPSRRGPASAAHSSSCCSWQAFRTLRSPPSCSWKRTATFSIVWGHPVMHSCNRDQILFSFRLGVKHISRKKSQVRMASSANCSSRAATDIFNHLLSFSV